MGMDAEETSINGLDGWGVETQTFRLRLADGLIGDATYAFLSIG
jgi:hypothetical protein